MNDEEGRAHNLMHNGMHILSTHTQLSRLRRQAEWGNRADRAELIGVRGSPKIKPLTSCTPRGLNSWLSNQI